MELKEPYDVVFAKLELADLTIELLSVREEKWRRHETMRDILEKEEELDKKLIEKREEIEELKKKCINLF